MVHRRAAVAVCELCHVERTREWGWINLAAKSSVVGLLWVELGG